MTQDEIIEMARQVCDIAIDNRGRHTFVCDEYGLEAFAKLVAQHEREAIYSIVMEAPFRQNLETELNAEDLLFAVKVMAFDITSAIRARGQA